MLIFAPLDFWGSCWSMFCNAVLSVLFSFVVILVDCLYDSLVTFGVLWLFLSVPWVGLKYGIVVFVLL